MTHDMAPSVKESYAIMKELQRGLNLSAQSYTSNGKEVLDIKLSYRTLDGRVHTVAETTIERKQHGTRIY